MNGANFISQQCLRHSFILTLASLDPPSFVGSCHVVVRSFVRAAPRATDCKYLATCGWQHIVRLVLSWFLHSFPLSILLLLIRLIFDLCRRLLPTRFPYRKVASASRCFRFGFVYAFFVFDRSFVQMPSLKCLTMRIMYANESNRHLCDTRFSVHYSGTFVDSRASRANCQVCLTYKKRTLALNSYTNSPTSCVSEKNRESGVLMTSDVHIHILDD